MDIEEEFEKIDMKYEKRVFEEALKIACMQKAESNCTNGNYEELAKMFYFDFITQAKEKLNNGR